MLGVSLYALIGCRRRLLVNPRQHVVACAAGGTTPAAILDAVPSCLTWIPHAAASRQWSGTWGALQCQYGRQECMATLVCMQQAAAVKTRRQPATAGMVHASSALQAGRTVPGRPFAAAEAVRGSSKLRSSPMGRPRVRLQMPCGSGQAERRDAAALQSGAPVCLLAASAYCKASAGSSLVDV